MKKYILIFTIFIFSLSYADTGNIDSIYTNDPFFNKIISACSLLNEVRELQKEGKSIKAENKYKEAIEILDKTILPNHILIINKNYKLRLNRKRFEIIFNTKDIYSIEFDFDYRIREVYDNFKNEKHLTNRIIAELIEDAKDGDMVETKFKIVPAVEYSVSKYYSIDTRYIDQGISILIAVQIMDFKVVK